MKNLFTKLLLLAAVATTFCACDDKDNDNDPKNYVEIDGRKSPLIGGFVYSMGADYSAAISLFGPGLTINSKEALSGIGDYLYLQLPKSVGGNYTVEAIGWNETRANGCFYKKADFTKLTEDPDCEEYGDLKLGTTIKYVKGAGNRVTIDIEGMYLVEDGKEAIPVKAHFEGEIPTFQWDS